MSATLGKRRTFLKNIIAGASLGLLKPGAVFATKPPEDGFSFLHLTDMHVRRKRQGHVGYQVCIDTVNKNNTTADFVLMGGDLAFDGNYTAKNEFADQLSLYKSISDSQTV
jgi:3',5'-cyclic-AMP phosphodiesterase